MTRRARTMGARDTSRRASMRAPALALATWATLTSHPFERRPCDVPRARASELDARTFAETFRASETPVVIVGLGARRAAFRALCERERLLEALGDEVVTLSSSNTHSYAKRRKTLRAYVEEDVSRRRTRGEDASETWYWFGDHAGEDGEYSDGFRALLDEYETLEYVPKDADVAHSFGVGGQFSGVPMHTHGPGWSESIIGRKHWFLAPPNAMPRFDPNVTAYEWALEAFERGEVHPGEGGVMECTVSAGEAIYFPPNWWHATVNLDESVFISSFVNYKAWRSADEL